MKTNKLIKNKIKKLFPNKKKFFYTIFFIFLFFLITIVPVKFFEHEKKIQKNTEIKKILIWSIEEYKKKSWNYPENLNQIEKFWIINDINILKNKKYIFYKKILNNDTQKYILNLTL